MTAHTSLRVKQLELSVYLGWQEEERSRQQIVYVDIEFCFSSPPKACLNDDLTDTVCYAELAKQLQEKCLQKSFRLIEHLAHEIYQLIKAQFPHTQLKVSLHKKPQVPGLVGGVTFCYAD